MKITRIAPVNATELPLGWASQAGVAPEESVQIIIKPLGMLNPGLHRPVHESVSARPTEAGDGPSSYLMRCGLFQRNRVEAD